jgi:hypothetical protein
MIDSIKLYEIVDEVKSRKDIIHPAVKQVYELDNWDISVIQVNRMSASLMLHMRWSSLIRIRYKWFRRVVDILNKCSVNSGIIFSLDPESFECEFEDRNSANGVGVIGYLSVYAHDEKDFLENSNEEEKAS